MNGKITLCLASVILSTAILTTAYATTTTTTSNPTPQTTTTSPSANPNAGKPTPATTSINTAATSLDKPNMKTDAVLKWAEEPVKAVYSYDFKNYKKQIQDTQQYFTPEGWKAFNDALAKSNNLKIVEAKKLVASAVTNKPVLLEEGVKKGRYTWKVQIPIVASYENESKLIKQNLIITLLITRTNSPSGLGISHFLAQIEPQNQTPSTTPQPVNPSGTPPKKDVPPPLANMPNTPNTNTGPINPTPLNNSGTTPTSDQMNNKNPNDATTPP